VQFADNLVVVGVVVVVVTNLRDFNLKLDMAHSTANAFMYCIRFYVVGLFVVEAFSVCLCYVSQYTA